jgi:hypothetical protein
LGLGEDVGHVLPKFLYPAVCSITTDRRNAC